MFNSKNNKLESNIESDIEILNSESEKYYS